MPFYASVGVSRVQTHLGRCRSLWGRRGASDELVRLTTLTKQGAAKPFAKAFLAEKHPSVTIIKGALDIDGEIPVECDTKDELMAACRGLVAEIQSRLSAIDVSIRMWEAPSYAKTLAKYEPDFDEPHVPAVAEYPPIMPCDECQTANAVRKLTGKGYPAHLLDKRLCADCATRAPAPGRQVTLNPSTSSRDGTPNGFVVESWLLEKVRKKSATHAWLSSVADFDELAKQVARDVAGRTNTSEDNHTALIFADANGLGGIFRALRASSGQRGRTKDIRAISTAIKKATGKALRAATHAILTENDPFLPVIPHIRGGDDVLLSLPAPRAWAFFRVFMATLETEFRKHVYGKVPTGLTLPSVSAGIVICKSSYPFGLQVDLVNRLIKVAKQAGQGREWRFTWLDVTADGAQPLSETERRPWTMQQLVDRTTALTWLVTEVGGTAEGSINADVGDPDFGAAALKIAARASRLDQVGQLLKLLSIPDVPDDDHIRLLREVTSLGRWWR